MTESRFAISILAKARRPYTRPDDGATGCRLAMATTLVNGEAPAGGHEQICKSAKRVVLSFGSYILALLHGLSLCAEWKGSPYRKKKGSSTRPNNGDSEVCVLSLAPSCWERI